MVSDVWDSERVLACTVSRLFFGRRESKLACLPFFRFLQLRTGRSDRDPVEASQFSGPTTGQFPKIEWGLSTEGFAMRFYASLLGSILSLSTGLLIGSGIARAAEAGDPAQGKKVFGKCQACHSLEPGVNKIGPTLHGIMGRPSGAEADFKYSDAMENAHLNWTPETLDQYLLNPSKMVPGTKMAFPGLTKEKDRADVISYLEQAAGASP